MFLEKKCSFLEKKCSEGYKNLRDECDQIGQLCKVGSGQILCPNLTTADATVMGIICVLPASERGHFCLLFTLPLESLFYSTYFFFLSAQYSRHLFSFSSLHDCFSQHLYLLLCDPRFSSVSSFVDHLCVSSLDCRPLSLSFISIRETASMAHFDAQSTSGYLVFLFFFFFFRCTPSFLAWLW